LKSHIRKYLDCYAERGPWKLTAKSLEGIQHAVVIPALAEYPHILETLHSLALNSSEELKKTLVVCVVNNRAIPHAEPDDVANNRKTLLLLDSLLKKTNIEWIDEKHNRWMEAIINSSIRLAYVDASSPGLELPEKAGVGLARKIGMDLSLSLMACGGEERNILFCLDADTLVEPNYLLRVMQHFTRRERLAAVVPFSHRNSADGPIQDAIAAYEAYLRYYVIGLKHARSPYAFHTVGSTMVSSAQGYAMVRGMPKRLAAEDFYFLNKLAKLRPVGFVEDTTVFPSPRHSSRTPFGTGKKVGQLINGEGEGAFFYHPEVFSILRKWLIHIEKNPHQAGENILEATAEIDPLLRVFLHDIGFVETWDKLKKNFPLRKNLLQQFHAWFDGFKTLKLIHYLTDYGYSKLPMSHAVEMMKSKIDGMRSAKSHGGYRSSKDVLASLRMMEKTIMQVLPQEISP